MRKLTILFITLLFSCKNESSQPDNFAIAQWDLRDKYDSIGGFDTYTFAKLLMFRNGKLYTYRTVDRYKNYDYGTHAYEYGECVGNIPEDLLEQTKFINPTNVDTLFPHNGKGIYDYLQYALVDLKTKRTSLFIPKNINETAFQVIDRLLEFADTTTIIKSNDTTDLHAIRESIRQMAIRHSIPTSEVNKPKLEAK